MSAEQTIEQFIEREGLEATVERAESNPNMTGMPAGSTHWLVTIMRTGVEGAANQAAATMVVPFSQGPAIDGEPELVDVLDCLASDAASVENARSFDDWAEEMGYFPMGSSDDFRKAERTYRAIEKQSSALNQLLGNEAFEALLYEAERR